MRIFRVIRLLGLSLSLTILGGCGMNEENKAVERVPPVTAEQVNSTPPPAVDNPSAPPIAPAEGAMPKEEAMPATGEVPVVTETPAAPTDTPKSE